MPGTPGSTPTVDLCASNATPYFDPCDGTSNPLLLGRGTVAGSASGAAFSNNDPNFSDVVLLMPLSSLSAPHDKSSFNQPVLFANSLQGVGGTPVWPTQLTPSDTLFGLETANLHVGLSPGATINNAFPSWATTSGLPATLQLLTSAWTIEFWFKIRSADSNRGGWAINAGGIGYAFGTSYTTNITAGLYSVYITTDGGVVYSQGPAGGTGARQRLGPTSATTLDTWHYVRVTKQSTTITVEVDGTVAASATETIAKSSPTGYFAVGGVWNQATPASQLYFVGRLAQVRLTQNVARTGPVPTRPFPTSL